MKENGLTVGREKKRVLEVMGEKDSEQIRALRIIGRWPAPVRA